MGLEIERSPFPWKHILLYCIEFVFLANILILDAVIAKTMFFSPQKNTAASIERVEKTVYITVTPSPVPLGTPSVNTTKQQSTSTSVSTLLPTVKEYYVPFGSGQSSSADWTDVPGIQAYVDSQNYPKIKTAVFEATVHVPNATQAVQVRLYNATDKHPVWFSDVTFSGTTTQLLVSQPITLDSGNKLYTVQMKTQLQAPAVLDQARLHITLQ